MKHSYLTSPQHSSFHDKRLKFPVNLRIRESLLAYLRPAIARLLLSLVLLPLGVWGQYVVDFEGVTKGPYESGTVNLSGLDWDLTEVLIGTLPNDWKNGARSARLRGYGTSSMTMVESKPNGVGTISFLYRRYGTDAQVDWRVEYSTDEGENWTQVGSDFTAPASDVVQTFSETLDNPGNIRIRIKRATETGVEERRLNIDDIIITDYKIEVIDFDNAGKWTAGSGGIASFQTDHQYNDKGWLFTGGPALRSTAALPDGSGAIGTYSWRLNNVVGTDWRANYTSRGIIEAFGFDVRRWADDPTLNWTVSYSTNGGSTFTDVLTVNNANLENSSDWKTFFFQLATPAQVDENQFVVRFSRVGGERIMVDNFTFRLQECTTAGLAFRTAISGEWPRATIWEVYDGFVWLPAYCVPGDLAAAVVVDHPVTITESKTLRNVIVNNTLSLQLQSGALTITGDPSTDGLVIENGGILSFDGAGHPNISSGVTVRVKSGGMIRVNTAQSAVSQNLAGSLSGQYIYETGSVFFWNINSQFTAGNQTYFPNADAATIPIFRTSVNITTNPGAGSATVFNGLFEANGNITFVGEGTKTFRNGITGTGTVGQAASSGAFIINGNTAQLGGSGTISLNSNGLQISSPSAQFLSNKAITGGPVTVTGTLNLVTNTLTLGNNLVVSGSGSLVSSGGGLSFNGSGGQVITLNNPITVSALTTTNTNSEGISFNNNVTVTSSLVMQGDITMTGTSIFQLGQSPSLRGNLTHSSGKINGRFKRWFDAATNTQEQGFFPIGFGSATNPVWVQFTEPPSGGSLTARFIGEEPANAYKGLPFTADGINFNNITRYGYWEINAGDGLNGGVYTLTINTNDINIPQPNSVRILKRADSNASWQLQGTFGGFSVPNLSQLGLSGFSDFTIGGDVGQNPLPIELISFSARRVASDVVLNWVTATETNNDFFTLHRSTDTESSEIIGFVQGAGNSTQLLTYTFADTQPLDGISYYRLQQTDFDGTTTFSNWIAVSPKEMEAALAIRQVVPSLSGSIVQASVVPGVPVRISVSDMLGRILYQEDIHPGESILHHPIPVNQSGVLIIKMSDRHGSHSLKYMSGL